jgi:hypothetical protein
MRNVRAMQIRAVAKYSVSWCYGGLSNAITTVFETVTISQYLTRDINILMLYDSQDCHSGAVVDSSLLVCYTVSVGVKFCGER